MYRGMLLLLHLVNENLVLYVYAAVQMICFVKYIFLFLCFLQVNWNSKNDDLHIGKLQEKHIQGN